MATDLGGMAELVQHGRTGLLFALNDAADLQAQLVRLRSEPGLLHSLREGIPVVKSVDDEMHEPSASMRPFKGLEKVERAECRESSG